MKEKIYDRLEALEKKYHIHSITRLDFPIYQLTKVPIIGNIVNTSEVEAKNGYVFDKLINTESRERFKRRNVIQNDVYNNSVMSVLRGLYNGDGADNFLERYINYEKQFDQNIYIIDRMMGGEYRTHKYLSLYSTSDFQTLIKQKIPRKFKLTKNETKIITKFQKELRKIGFKGDFYRLFNHKLKKFYSEYYNYLLFLKEKNLKEYI